MKCFQNHAQSRQWKLFVNLLFLCSTASAIAQSSVSSLRGSVADSSGAVVVGAQVALENKATGFSSSRATNSQGEFQFLQIPAGSYIITVSKSGFSAQSKTAELLVNQPATVGFSLSVQALNTEVVVNADASVLNFVDASMGDAVNQATIAALPMEGRNVPELLSLQPGVLYLGTGIDQTHDSRTGASAGGRSDQGNITLDGVDNNDQVSGYAYTGVLRSTLDSVQEFRVTTVGYGADTGRSSGAQVNLLTKSGTNELHGSIYEYNRSSLGEANNWFNKQAELNSSLPNVPGKLVHNTFGASVGGPVKKGKAFFFINYEGQRTEENQQKTLVVPTASMRAGNIMYPHTEGSTTTNVTLDPTYISGMHQNCTVNCRGVNSAVVTELNKYQLPNIATSGDGLNTSSFTWSAPNPIALNTYIARFDYNLSRNNWLFARGNLQNDSSSDVPQFPGDAASASNTDNSKGFVVGDTWNLSPSLINNLRYTYTRQGYSSRGIGQGTYANFYGISQLEAETRTTLVDVPVHNIVDDMTWTHKTHTIQFGINYRLIHNNRQSDALSYNYGYTNSYALEDAGIVGTGQSFDPDTFGPKTVDSSFASSYNYAMTNLVGLLDLVTTQVNYQISSDGKTGSLLGQGAMLNRTFKSNEFEYYVQDSWRVRPSLTVTVGLRHTLLQTPYETHGQQAQPTLDMDQWFKTRGQQAALGNSYSQEISFAPSGQARGLKPYWPMQKANFAPRFSIAYSPSAEDGFWHKLFGGAGKSSIRAGYGLYYDHYGEGIVNSFDQFGSFGLSESISNATNYLTPDTSPLFTNIHDLNSTGLVVDPDNPVNYPALAPDKPLGYGFAITHGLDDHMKTPYAHVVNFSFQRELPGGFVLETSYIGRFGRNQLQQIDMAQPVDLVDTKSGQDYYTAATELSKHSYAGDASVAKIPYFENMFASAAGCGNSATQNIYDMWLPGNETGSLYMLDILGATYCGGITEPTNRFWPTQFASMYSWSSIGSSNYNAGQVTLRHRMSHGVQLELSYTLSKSLDMGSDAERTTYSASTGTSSGSSFGAILNAWNPHANYAPSDFDVRHLITGNWVVLLPFGRGKALLNGASRVLDSAIGNWQFAGVARWTSGLPFSIVCGAGWGTSWDEHAGMIQTGPIKTHTHIGSNGAPQAFADPVAAQNNMRNPYPGEAGQRNNYRGDGYFGADTSLSKSWKIGDRSGIKFAWEVFNVTNSVRFDVNPLTSMQNMTTSGEFGVYGATLTKPRVQQFSLRCSF